MAKVNPITAAHQDGQVAGWNEARQKVLDHLEAKYLSGAVERGTPMAEAILKLAAEMSTLLEAK